VSGDPPLKRWSQSVVSGDAITIKQNKKVDPKCSECWVGGMSVTRTQNKKVCD